MGDLLLKGWTTLAEGCGDCRVPLMQEHQTGDKLCSNCQRRVTGGDVAWGPRPPLGIISNNPGKGTFEDPLLMGRWLGPNGGMFQEHQLSPAGPLQLDYRSSRCGTHSQVHSSTLSASNLYADKIAEKMVEGWTLTCMACLRCHTPLVRSKDKSLYCVGCELTTAIETSASSPRGVQSPATPDASGGQKWSQNERLPHEEEPPVRKKPLLMTEPSNQGVGGSDVQEHLEEGQMDVESGCIADLDTVHGDVGIVTAEGTCGEGWQDACALWADGDSKTKGTDVRCALEQAVLGKMAEVGKLVSETPPVQSEELGKRLRLLKECIDVVNALKDLAF